MFGKKHLASHWWYSTFAWFNHFDTSNYTASTCISLIPINMMSLFNHQLKLEIINYFWLKIVTITTYLFNLLLYKNFFLSPFCQSAMIERAEKIKFILIQFFLDCKESECFTEVPSSGDVHTVPGLTIFIPIITLPANASGWCQSNMMSLIYHQLEL